MSKPTVIIKSINLNDIDLDEDFSDDDDTISSRNNFESELRFLTDDDVKFTPGEETLTEVSNVILSDIKTEEAIELTSGTPDTEEIFPTLSESSTRNFARKSTSAPLHKRTLQQTEFVIKEEIVDFEPPVKLARLTPQFVVKREPTTSPPRSLSEMFQNTLKKNQPAKKTHNWVKFSKATPELLNIDTASNDLVRIIQKRPKTPPVRVPRTITISKVSSVARKATFKCITCSMSFFEERLHAQHMRDVHEGETKRFRCMKCRASFASMEELKTHVDTHGRHEDHADTFACTACEKKFSRADLLASHTRVFHSSKAKMFKCAVCGYETRVKQNMEKHENMHLRYAEKLRTNKFFYCDQCPQSFRDESVLQGHKDFMHA